MVGFSSFKSFKFLRKRFPDLCFDGFLPTTDEFLYEGLSGGTLMLEKLTGEQWEVLFPPLSERKSA